MATRIESVDDTGPPGRISGIFVISAKECQSYAPSMKAERAITAHRCEAGVFPVNASLIKTSTRIVVVDATLSVSDGKNVRSRVEVLSKPLAAVIITHAHPDHCGGVSLLLGDLDVPVYA